MTPTRKKREVSKRVRCTWCGSLRPRSTTMPDEFVAGGPPICRDRLECNLRLRLGS